MDLINVTHSLIFLKASFPLWPVYRISSPKELRLVTFSGVLPGVALGQPRQRVGPTFPRKSRCQAMRLEGPTFNLFA